MDVRLPHDALLLLESGPLGGGHPRAVLTQWSDELALLSYVSLYPIGYNCGSTKVLSSHYEFVKSVTRGAILMLKCIYGEDEDNPYRRRRGASSGESTRGPNRKG